MKRINSKVKLSDNSYKNKVKIQDDFICEPDTIEYKVRQHQFLKEFIQNHELFLCGGKPFLSLVMSHEGGYWILYLESIIEMEDNSQ